jgi:hypothetical protein
MGKHRKLFTIFLMIGLSAIFLFLGFSNNSIVRTETIQKIGSFPSEDAAPASVFLNGSLYMDKDSAGNIYISNSKEGNIYCFDSDGDYSSTIGRKGQGPGELSYPTNILVTDELVIVQDIGNHKMQIFNKAGKALASFKLYKTYENIVLNKEKMIIYAAPMLGNPKENLVDVLDLDGKMLKSFGSPIEYEHKWATLNSVRLALMDNGELILGFALLPIIRRYSPEGRLLAEHRIDYEPSVEKGKENLARYRKSLAKRTNPAFYMIINCLRVERDRMFLLSTSPGVTVLGYDNALSLKKAYTGIIEEDYFANDFIIKEAGGQIFFYLLQVLPENIVNIFGRK